MRPIEALLSLTNLLTFFALAIPLPRAVFWMRYLAPLALLIAVAQILIESPRWQMVPAYALAGFSFLVWLLQNIMPLDGTSGQILVKHLAIGLSALVLIVSIILPIILPVFRFPHPSGPYDIGTLTYHWVDADRPEVFSADPSARRELMVQIWYPARKESSSPYAPYIQDSDAITTALAQLHNFPDFSLKHLKYFTTNTISSAPIADNMPNYPVLIFLEGLTGYRQMNTFQVEELVSYGYIVVGIDQPGVAASVVFPDGHQIAGLSKTQMDPLTQQSVSPSEILPLLNGQIFKDGIISYFAQDVSFTLDQLAVINTTDPKSILTGRLDLHHTGLFGVSFGGIVGAEACLKDPRIKACLIEDVAITADVVQKGLQQPTMFITRPANTMRLERKKTGGWTEKDIEQTQSTMRAVYNSLPGDGYFVQVPGMFHIDLTDLDLLSPIFPTIGFSGPIGSQRAHDIINAYSLAFFNRHLKGQAGALLNGPVEQFSEILFETRRP
ncbi:MAG: carboxylic ester hydrolase [Anaerolineales bacterium]|nr:carboxylic ester hydrolase [Anaerolineales bacterium]